MKGSKKNIFLSLALIVAVGFVVFTVSNFSLQLGSLFRAQPPVLTLPLTKSGEYSIEYEQQTSRFSRFTRFARVYVPSGYFKEKPLPVVFVFHGGGGNSGQAMNDTRFNEVADKNNFIVVYPEGIYTPRAWNAGECCGDSARRNVDDSGFVMAVLDKLEAHLDIDKRRVYATGFSNGSSMAYRLACEHADTFAAVAGVSGPTVLSNCNPSRAIPILQLHGTADTTISTEGGEGDSKSGYDYPSLAENQDLWASINSCDRNSLKNYNPEFEPGALQWLTGNEFPMTCSVFTKCSGSSTVGICTIEGWGHEWPVGWRSGIEAAEFIWNDFFSAYSLR